MKLESLIKRLEDAALLSEEDKALGHLKADEALLDYIDNQKIRTAYEKVVMGYE